MIDLSDGFQRFIDIGIAAPQRDPSHRLPERHGCQCADKPRLSDLPQKFGGEIFSVRFRSLVDAFRQGIDRFADHFLHALSNGFLGNAGKTRLAHIFESVIRKAFAHTGNSSDSSSRKLFGNGFDSTAGSTVGKPLVILGAVIVGVLHGVSCGACCRNAETDGFGRRSAERGAARDGCRHYRRKHLTHTRSHALDDLADLVILGIRIFGQLIDVLADPFLGGVIGNEPLCAVLDILVKSTSDRTAETDHRIHQALDGAERTGYHLALNAARRCDVTQDRIHVIGRRLDRALHRLCLGLLGGILFSCFLLCLRSALSGRLYIPVSPRQILLIDLLPCFICHAFLLFCLCYLIERYRFTFGVSEGEVT